MKILCKIFGHKYDFTKIMMYGIICTSINKRSLNLPKGLECERCERMELWKNIKI